MKGSGGSLSGFLLNPLSPESLVFSGAALDGLGVSNISLVMKPFASGEEEPAPSPFSRLRLLWPLGLGGKTEKIRSDVSRNGNYLQSSEMSLLRTTQAKDHNHV